jgi:hypothetical protein
MRRVIGMDLHRTFAEVVFWEDGTVDRLLRGDLARSRTKPPAASAPGDALRLWSVAYPHRCRLVRDVFASDPRFAGQKGMSAQTGSRSESRASATPSIVSELIALAGRTPNFLQKNTVIGGLRLADAGLVLR